MYTSIIILTITFIIRILKLILSRMLRYLRYSIVTMITLPVFEKITFIGMEIGIGKNEDLGMHSFNVGM